MLCVCMYMCENVGDWEYVCLNVCLCVCECVFVCIYEYINVHVCMYEEVCVFSVYIYVYMYVCMYVCSTCVSDLLLKSSVCTNYLIFLPFLKHIKLVLPFYSKDRTRVFYRQIQHGYSYL